MLGGANLQAPGRWAGSQGQQGIGRKSVGRQTGGRWVTTVSGGGRKTKLQADGGEAIGGDREQALERDWEGPFVISEGGERGTREINEDGNNSTPT